MTNSLSFPNALPFQSSTEYESDIHSSDGRIALEDAPIGFYRSSLDGSLTYANTYFAQIMGYGSSKELLDEVGGSEHFIRVHPVVAKNDLEKLSSLGILRDFVYTTQKKNGDVVWISSDVLAVHDEKNELIQYEGFVFDITKYKKIQQDIATSRNITRAVLDSTNDFAFLINMEGTINAANKSFAELHGTTPKNLFNKTIESIYPARVYKKIRFFLERANQKKSKAKFVIKHKHSFYSYTIYPLVDNDHSVHSFTVFVHDITDVVKSKKILRANANAQNEARRAAEETVRIKNEFIANVSHELRTPVSGIIGLLGRMFEAGPSDEQRINLRKIYNQADHLLAIINDLLDFSRYQSGKFILEQHVFNFRDLITALNDALAVYAEEKGLNYAVAVDNNVPSFVQGDSHRIRQILSNLVFNAIKFTARGSVSVNIGVANRRSLDEGRERVALHFTVQDTGIGIPEDKLEIVFDSFTQADGSHSRIYGGTGLGLSVSKLLVELMHGRIWAESQVGKGSSFHFIITLPTAPTGVIEASPEQFKALSVRELGRQIHVLIAEDNLIIQDVLSDFFMKLGHLVHVVETGRDAVAYMNSGSPVDLVLMDIQMPIMDGFEAARIIRGLQDTSRAGVPIICLSAHAVEDFRDQCLAAGMDDYLAKPINFQLLQNKINEYMAPFAAGVSSEAEETSFLELIPATKTTSRDDTFPPPTHACVPHECPTPSRSSATSVLASEYGLFSRRSGKDKRLIAVTCRSFVKHCPRYVDDLAKAVATVNFQEIRRLTHSLKSSVLMFDNQPTTEALTKLNEAAHQMNGDALRAALKTLQDALMRTREAAAEYLALEETDQS